MRRVAADPWIRRTPSLRPSRHGPRPPVERAARRPPTAIPDTIPRGADRRIRCAPRYIHTSTANGTMPCKTKHHAVVSQQRNDHARAVTVAPHRRGITNMQRNRAQGPVIRPQIRIITTRIAERPHVLLLAIPCKTHLGGIPAPTPEPAVEQRRYDNRVHHSGIAFPAR